MGAEEACHYEVVEQKTEEESASAKLLCHFANGKTVAESYTVNASGAAVAIAGEGEVGFSLPAFVFDGEKEITVSVDAHTLAVSYEGWVCRYTTDGTIQNLGWIAANQNGHYRSYLATAQNELRVQIQIEKE